MYKVLNIFILPLLVLISIWYELINEYYVPDVFISESTVDQSNKYPLKKQSDAIEALEFGVLNPKMDSEELVRSAFSITQGKIGLGKLSKVDIKLPFDASLVNASDSSWQLGYNGFIIPRVLILAYDETGNDVFLRTALNFILGWHEFEKKQWIRDDFVWNDHALASRGVVLASFWVRYKNHRLYKKEDAKNILHLVNRTAALLGNDRLYTYKTNHGTMQSLALMKLSVYFPLLKNMENYKTKAIERLNNQFKFFINNEGVVLEHSAEYHHFGVFLLNTAKKLYEINGVTVPNSLQLKYKKSLLFLDQLYRPDNTLPLIGDTTTAKQSKNSIARINDKKVNDVNTDRDVGISIRSYLVKKAGYSIWWSLDNTSKIAQTAIAWSYFPYMGHKHADELSVNVWSRGVNWLRSVGYWPYTDKNRSKAIGWSGSNAPHLENEDSKSSRKSNVISIGKGKSYQFLELQRKENSGFSVRRQILQIGEEHWLIIDSFNDTILNRNAQTLWSVDPSIRLKKLPSGNGFILSTLNVDKKMIMTILSSNRNELEIVKGDKSRLLGWSTVGVNIVPSYSPLVTLPSHKSWSVLALRSKSEGIEPEVTLVNWTHVKKWTIKSGNVEIKRNENELYIKSHLKLVDKVLLNNIVHTQQEDEEDYKFYKQLEVKYGKPLRPLIKYRIKVTFLIILLSIILCVFSYFLRSYLLNRINIVITLFWVGFMIWLNQNYFI